MGSLEEEKTFTDADTFEKNQCKRNGEINGNVFTSEEKESKNSKSATSELPAKTKPRFPKQTTKPITKSKIFDLLILIWFSIECIICHVALLTIAVALSPLLITYNILKTLERLFAWATRGAYSVSGQDALWQQDSDTNRLIITSVLIAPKSENIEKELVKFREVVLERMVKAKNDCGELIYPRVRWCIRPGYFQYFFEEEKNFQIEKHVYKYEGSEPTSKDELEEIVSKLSGEPLPENLSPWYYCAVPTNYGNKDIIVIFRAHHSMADGVSLARFLTGKLPDYKIPEKEPVKFSSKRRLPNFAKAFFIMGRVFFKQLFRSSNKSVLHGPELSGVKKVVWSTATDLELIKKIKTVTGTTINDVLMTCLSMAIRGYYKRRGIQNPPDFEACIPVDVRPFKKELSFENRFAVVFLTLPSSIDGALAQLDETKARMDIIKTSGEPISMAWLMHLAVAFCPEALIKPILGFISSKASCVLSNVPGPQVPIQIAKKEIKSLTFWPPQRNIIGIGLSIFTYAGMVFVGVQCDVALMTDPGVVLEEYSKAVKELSNAVLMST